MNITELDLPHIDITDQNFANDPFPVYREAIKQHWLASTPNGFMILSYQDMHDLLIKDDILKTPNQAITQLMGAEDSFWGGWNSRFLLAKTGDEHKRIRGLVAKSFTPRSAEMNRPVMREVINNLLDDWAIKESFDFNEFSSNFPIRVMCRLLGADPEIVPEIKDSLETMGSGFSMDPSILPELDKALKFMWGFVDNLLTEREANSPSDEEGKDLLDYLIDSTKVENGMSRQELYDLVILLFGGGYDTSKNGLNLIIHQLLDKPDYWQRLIDNEKGFAKAVLDETLRYTNVVTTYRIVKEEFVWKEVTIPAGTMLIFPIPLSGQDGNVYSDTTWNPDRGKSEARSFAFGRGEHNCLGQFIARAQIEEALPIIASRMPELCRNGEPTWRPFPGIWGISSLPVKTRKAA